MTNDLRKWLVCFILTDASALISYKWLDRPIAFFVHDHMSQKDIFIWLQRIPEALPPLAALAFIALGLLALSKSRVSMFQAELLLCSISLVVAEAIKDQLKFVFGRTWPETWVSNNPSLIQDGIYGFHPFHGGIGFASFPSGHAAAICAVMSILWIYYRKFRPLYVICVATVVVGLTGANYHFFSDIIVGAFIGVSTGWMAVAIWQLANSDSLGSDSFRTK
jgi:membrane-associated phospholipid phosphatase